MNYIRYLKIDMERALCSWKLLVAGMGVCVGLAYESYMNGVLHWMCMNISSSTMIMAAFIFVLYPYGGSLCEDTEYCYDRQMVLRGSVTSYILSKITAAFLSAALTALLGFYFAVLFLWGKDGFPNMGLLCDSNMDMYSHNPYFSILLDGNYFLFTLCMGLHISCLAGILGVVGLLCSLFVKNPMLVYILPVAFMYVTDILIERLFGWQLGCLISIKYMGVGMLGGSVEGQSLQLYCFEIVLLLVLFGSVINLVYRKKVG